jgi:hypothetical protein
MSERIMVVTGAFATHTTKLYNYYVCPINWDIDNLKYIAVNYLSELYYLGQVEGEPIEWSYNETTQIVTIPNNLQITNEVRNDLQQFKTLLNGGSHYLFRLTPIIGSCVHENLHYKLKGAFTRSHIYFDNIGEMLARHQGLIAIPNSGIENNEPPTAINDNEIFF